MFQTAIQFKEGLDCAERALKRGDPCFPSKDCPSWQVQGGYKRAPDFAAVFQKLFYQRNLTMTYLIKNYGVTGNDHYLVPKEALFDLRPFTVVESRLGN